MIKGGKKKMSWEKKMTLTSLACGLLVILWNVGDYTGVRPTIKLENDATMELAQANSKQLLVMRYQYLEALRKNKGLDPAQRVEYCLITKELGFKGVGC